ncbi:hypothetical protein [Paraburkholderia sp. HD33-4]|uniref:hypothetical protein n=1 Tax=Paraburkholderia sp. HD33-4 TaxID=2883242 RepID=UPI001F3D6D5B|nr:hypothetical protein [Paraburkholderia sp. HD33-4]
MKLPFSGSPAIGFLALALLATAAPVHAQTQQWVLKVKEANCYAGTLFCRADAYYYETSSLEAYHCVAYSKGNVGATFARARVDKVFCTRMNIPLSSDGKVDIEPAAGQPEDAGNPLPPGATMKFAWGDGFWVSSETKKGVSYCVNTATMPVAQVCGPATVWN